MLKYYASSAKTLGDLGAATTRTFVELTIFLSS
jgi:hypothetical protein